MKPGDIQNFLKARSPRGLRLLMLKNNVKKKTTYIYSTPQFANGSWWTWFTDSPFDLLEGEPVQPQAARVNNGD